MNFAKAKEAQPILKRNQHYFKIVTLYVMDKFTFNLQQKQKARQHHRLHNQHQSFHSGSQKQQVLSSAQQQNSFSHLQQTGTDQAAKGQKLSEAAADNGLNLEGIGSTQVIREDKGLEQKQKQQVGGSGEASGSQKPTTALSNHSYGLRQGDPPQNKSNINEQENLSQFSGSNLAINEKLSESQLNDQQLAISNQRITSGIPFIRTGKRSSSNPIKQIPSHFNHGDRTYKKCIVCESKIKTHPQKSKDQSALIPTVSAPTGATQKAELKNGLQSHQDDQGFDQQHKRFKETIRQDSFKQTFSVHSNTFGGKIESGGQPNFSAQQTHYQNFANNQVSQFSLGASGFGGGPLSINQYPQPAPSIDLSESGLQSTTLAQPMLNKLKSERKQAQLREPLSPTKRDLEMEEFQKRRISLDDFQQGAPSLKMTFSKHVRKFNRELLKATCQAIGCKPINANQIAEGVLDEINLILNNLSQSIDFEMHFQIQQQEVSKDDAQEQKNDIAKSGVSEELKKNSSSEDPLTSKPQKKKHQYITTITTSAPLFKYILSKHLEKYKYSRPEYLKDFYITSDLVQSKRNILVLLAGTSGTGKSTLASLLGSRLGISTVLSTDTIRHVMRNFVSKEENPVLFASTYETSAFAPPEITSEKKRTLYGYKDQCDRVQAELEKVIEDFQQRNESLVVEGVHLTVRFMTQMMKKYPSCIPFVLCIKNEKKHKERFAVRTKHMTIDPRFNKYIKNMKSIRIIQKYLIKKAEEVLIPRIDNSNVDKSIGLIHVTIVRCLRQIAEGAQIFDSQRKQATIMHHEFNLISKNQLSSRDAQQIIKQKVNKNEILQLYMQQANPEIQDRLKKYKRGQSMGDLKRKKWKVVESPAITQALGLGVLNVHTNTSNSTTTSDKSQAKVEIQKQTNLIHQNEIASINQQLNPDLILQPAFERRMGRRRDHEDEDDIIEEIPKAKSVHIIMRPDEEEKGRKVTELERKNMKKQFLNIMNDFSDEEEMLQDSQAAKLAAQSQKNLPPKSKKKDKDQKKNKVLNEEEQKLRDEKKRQSDHQRKIEEEKIQSAINEAKKKEKEELEKQEKIQAEAKQMQEMLEKERKEKERAEKERLEKEKAEQIERQQKIESMLSQINPKSQSMTLPNTNQKQQKQRNEKPQQRLKTPSQGSQGSSISQERDLSFGLEESEEVRIDIKRQQSNSPVAPINIVNIKQQIKYEELNQQTNQALNAQQSPILNQKQRSLSKERQSCNLTSIPGQMVQKKLRFKIQQAEKEEPLDLSLNQGGSMTTGILSKNFSSSNNFTELENAEKIEQLIGVAKSKKVKFQSGAETKSMTSLEHLKQMDSEQVDVSKISSDDTSHDQLQAESKSVGRAPIMEKFQHKQSQFKIERTDREEFKSLEPAESKQLKQIGSYSQKMVGFEGLEKNTPDRNLALLDSKANVLLRHRIGTSKKGTKSKKKSTVLRGLNIFPQNSFGASTSQTPQGRPSLGQLTVQSPSNQIFSSNTQVLQLQGQQSDIANVLNNSSQFKQQIQPSIIEANMNQSNTQQIHGLNVHDDTQSQYSGNSGMAPSLVSHTINYFPQGGRTEDDNQSVMIEQLNESRGSSGDTDSMHVEDSFYDAISEEVSYSQSTDSEHEEEQIEDKIQQKEAHFNKAAAEDEQLQNQMQIESKNHQNVLQSQQYSPPRENHEHVIQQSLKVQSTAAFNPDNQHLRNIPHNASQNNLNFQKILDDPSFFQYDEQIEVQQIENNLNKIDLITRQHLPQ